uniref:leukocyte cell-derived chemotaxin 1 n=1 Tax=Euleptes europaea TaxID=460621 RepID=UPI002542667A|nr:leukocyte cell-derived chemotaxin 1 [Euleptes europaea]
MSGGLEKAPLAAAGPEEPERCPTPPAYSAVMAKPSSTGRLLRIGAMALISGALLLLLGAIGAFYYWKANDKELYNVHYTMSINGKVQEASMEIDAGNNLEIFKTGSGSEEAIEVHDFQIGITGIRFAGGEKCFIKAQAKTRVPEVNAMAKETLSFDLEDEILPAKFDENSLVWVAADQPIKNNNFLSPKILELCGDLQIFWLRPSYPKVGQRRKRGATRGRRQAQSNFDLDQFEAAAEEANLRPRAPQRAREQERPSNDTRPSGRDVRPTFNPDNPYHQLEGREGMTFDPRLDHEGICCIECRRSYTHCQRICEPLLGYYPWPYNYQGCRSACRLIMPCSWWVARILGVV